jgi:hypothetical protein
MRSTLLEVVAICMVVDCPKIVLLCMVLLLQVWALQQGSDVYVVGKSNRSKVLFEKELDSALDAVPEVQQ